MKVWHNSVNTTKQLPFVLYITNNYSTVSLKFSVMVAYMKVTLSKPIFM